MSILEWVEDVLPQVVTQDTAALTVIAVDGKGNLKHAYWNTSTMDRAKMIQELNSEQILQVIKDNAETINDILISGGSETNMYTIGFVDNSFDLLPDYKTRLGRHGIDLLFPEAGKSKPEIANWILQNDVRCLMVDHKLRPNFDFVGTDLVAYINSALPDLPCMILTAYQQESLNENLVIKNMIESRDILDAPDLTEFCEELKQAVNVFSKRLDLHESETQTGH